MILLIDISNSYTKLAWCREDGFTGNKATLPTAELTPEALQDSVGRRRVEAVVLSSVVPERNAIVTDSWRRVHVVDYRSPIGVGIDYPEPATIGADRLANASAIAAFYRFPAVVVDFGTAVTFDVLSVQGNYVGGVIAPGLEMMSDYLAGKTALLPRLRHWQKVDVLGKSTVHAMQAGAFYGYRGMVREILTGLRQRQEFGGLEPQVLATGGYAALIGEELEEIDAIDADLTLRGLWHIALRAGLVSDGSPGR